MDDQCYFSIIRDFFLNESMYIGSLKAILNETKDIAFVKNYLKDQYHNQIAL